MVSCGIHLCGRQVRHRGGRTRLELILSTPMINVSPYHGNSFPWTRSSLYKTETDTTQTHQRQFKAYQMCGAQPVHSPRSGLAPSQGGTIFLTDVVANTFEQLRFYKFCFFPASQPTCIGTNSLLDCLTPRCLGDEDGSSRGGMFLGRGLHIGMLRVASFPYGIVPRYVSTYHVNRKREPCVQVV